MPEVSIKRKELKSLPLPDGASTETTSTNINNKLQSTTEGTSIKLTVSDYETQNILTGILKELKIMNIHLSIITEIDVTKSEIE
jgi:hypothetical protein